MAKKRRKELLEEWRALRKTRKATGGVKKDRFISGGKHAAWKAIEELSPPPDNSGYKKHLRNALKLGETGKYPKAKHSSANKNTNTQDP